MSQSGEPRRVGPCTRRRHALNHFGPGKRVQHYAFLGNIFLRIDFMSEMMEKGLKDDNWVLLQLTCFVKFRPCCKVLSKLSLFRPVRPSSLLQISSPT